MVGGESRNPPLFNSLSSTRYVIIVDSRGALLNLEELDSYKIIYEAVSPASPVRSHAKLQPASLLCVYTVGLELLIHHW
jgi:hypothetical protein